MKTPRWAVNMIEPGTVITPEIYDFMATGDSYPNRFVRTYPNAEALQKACEAYVAKRGGNQKYHAVRRMYWTWYSRQRNHTGGTYNPIAYQRRKTKLHGQQAEGELAYADDVQRVVQDQERHMKSARRITSGKSTKRI